MKVLISGASGMIGTALLKHLENDHDVYRLVRRKSMSGHEIEWDYTRHFIEDKFHEQQFDAVIHLSGENIAAGPWTAKRKREIVNSRTESTLFLCDLIIQQKNPPQTFISASAVGIYGNRGDEILDETARAGSGFLADTCNEWEYCSKHLLTKNIRVVHLRAGIVLSQSGGFLAKLLPVFKLGLGGRLGNGKMYMSWIDLEDLLSIYQFVLENDRIEGAVNASAPNPVTNSEFTTSLAKLLRRPAFFHLPAWLLTFVFGDMAKEAM
ncbi:MAG: TIGR01777 family oxidoreductase, partial [Calditrichaeota bacterium]|nr:TIGR01777 family oxidoreductase [Calditrichota bacterium]